MRFTLGTMFLATAMLALAIAAMMYHAQQWTRDGGWITSREGCE